LYFNKSKINAKIIVDLEIIIVTNVIIATPAWGRGWEFQLRNSLIFRKFLMLATPWEFCRLLGSLGILGKGVVSGIIPGPSDPRRLEVAHELVFSTVAEGFWQASSDLGHPEKGSFAGR
jgi:hypothetical protein